MKSRAEGTRRRAALAVGGAAAGLVLAAAAAALLGARPAGFGTEYIYRSPLDDFFTPGEESGGRRVFTPNRLGRADSDLPKSFTMPKPPGVRRVFIVGGSVVQLFREGRLKELLEGVDPGSSWEIIDCGMSAYDSTRDRLTVEEIVGYDPDLVILMSGVNEGERQPLGLSRALGTLLLGARKGRFARARALVFPDLVWDPLRAALPAVVWEPSPDALLAGFSENLGAIISRTRAARAPLLLCTLPWNLRDMPPRGAPPLGDQAFLDGWIFFERGLWAEAAAEWRRALDAAVKPGAARSPSSRMRLAFLRYFLAKALDRTGKTGEAFELYSRATDTQTPPIIRINARLREIAASEGVPLADIAEAFSEAAGGVPGSDLLEDDMHWERFADDIAAAPLVRAMSRLWGLPWPQREDARLRAAKPSPGAVRDQAWTAFTIRVWDGSLSRRERLSERVISLVAAMDAAHPDLVRGVAGLESWIRTLLEDNVWQRGTAADFELWWPAFLGHVGEYFLRAGDPERALALFDSALAADSGLDAVRVRRGAALLRLGRLEDARAAFAALGRRRRIYPEIARYEALGSALAGDAAPRPGPAAPDSAARLLKEAEIFTVQSGLRSGDDEDHDGPR